MPADIKVTVKGFSMVDGKAHRLDHAEGLTDYSQTRLVVEGKDLVGFTGKVTGHPLHRSSEYCMGNIYGWTYHTGLSWQYVAPEDEHLYAY